MSEIRDIEERVYTIGDKTAIVNATLYQFADAARELRYGIRSRREGDDSPLNFCQWTTSGSYIGGFPDEATAWRESEPHMARYYSAWQRVDHLTKRLV
jgi:hypothetical protein